MQLETANYLIRGVSPSSVVNDSIDKYRFSSLTLQHVTSGLTGGEMSQGSGEKEQKQAAYTYSILLC